MGLIFLIPLCLIFPKKFSSGSWLKTLGIIYENPKSPNVDHKVLKCLMVFNKFFRLGGTNDASPFLNLKVLNVSKDLSQKAICGELLHVALLSGFPGVAENELPFKLSNSWSRKFNSLAVPIADLGILRTPSSVSIVVSVRKK